jgi:hypothetical protein
VNRKTIAIDINEVLRYRWIQFDRFYVEEFGEEGIPEMAYVYDFWKEYKWEDKVETMKMLNEDLPDNISPLDYQVDEKTGEAPVDVFAFKTETKTIPAREVFKRFMYQDFNFEIHGSAPLMYKGLDKDLEKFYKKYKDQFNIKIVSKENWFTIPPTLFFLSKCMPRIQNYCLVETNEEIWHNCDILITSDPELLTNVPRGKKVIKVLRPYNENKSYKGELNIFQILDLLETDDEEVKTSSHEFDKIIGYKPLK